MPRREKSVSQSAGMVADVVTGKLDVRAAAKLPAVGTGPSAMLSEESAIEKIPERSRGNRKRDCMSADYTVFIDESLYEWFGLPKMGSNLCYAALSLPTNRLGDLERFEKSVRRFAFANLPPDKKVSPLPDEFKYTDFRHLTPDVIDELGSKLAYFLEKNEATIFGFFIPAEGIFNYQLRTDFIDDAEALRNLPKADHEKRLEEIRAQMLKEWEADEHCLGALKEAYKVFFNFNVQHHGHYLKKTFRIEYDSRHPEEDAALHKYAEDFARDKADRISPGAFAHYQGYSSVSSKTSVGLRLVDWIAGEVRAFFYRNPAILSGDSKLEVLSPYLNSKMLLIDERAPYYRRELSPEAKECFVKSGQRFMLPQIKKFFASGLLTYYAQHGEARHIFIPKLIALDMAD